MTPKFTLTGQDEVDLVHAALIGARSRAFAAWRAAEVPEEAAFYAKVMATHDAMIARFEALRIADTSQDAEPDEDDQEIEE